MNNYYFVHTRLGKVAMNKEPLFKFEISDNQKLASIRLAILPADKYNDKPTYCLFWEWGADWEIFEDGAEYDIEQLSGWEPAVIREAIEEAIKLEAACAEDMHWFTQWADTAEKTLAIN